MLNTGSVKDCLEFHKFNHKRLCDESRGTAVAAWCVSECWRGLWSTENIIHPPVFVERSYFTLWCHWTILHLCWLMGPQISSWLCYEDNSGLHLVQLQGQSASLWWSLIKSCPDETSLWLWTRAATTCWWRWPICCFSIISKPIWRWRGQESVRGNLPLSSGNSYQ